MVISASIGWFAFNSWICFVKKFKEKHSNFLNFKNIQNLILLSKRMAKEILKDVEPDLVLVCCGGGSLLAGLSAGFSLFGSKAIIYGVEPATGKFKWDIYKYIS